MMTLSLLPFLLSAGLSLGLGVHAAGHIRVRGAAPFVVMSFTAAGWTLLYTLETISPDLEQKWFWDVLQWIPAYLFSLATLRFCLIIVRHTYRIPFSALLIVTSILVMLTLYSSAAPSSHADLRLTGAPPFYALDYSFNPLEWAGIIFTYVLPIFSVFVLLRQYRDSHDTYHEQMRYLSIGLLVGLVMSLAALLLDIRLLGQREITPFAFAICNLIIARGLFRYQLFNLGSSARMIVVEGMTDPFIVIDHEGRIIDLNSAARRDALTKQDQLEGQPAAAIFPHWLRHADLITDAESVTREVTSNEDVYEVRSLAVYDSDQRRVGRLITVRDITTLKLAQEHEVALRLERERARLLAHFIQSASHEFRTPLTSIGTSLYLITRTTSPDQIIRHREKANGEIRRITQLVDDLELMAALDSGVPLPREPSSLVMLVQMAIHHTEAVAASRQIGIDFALTGEPLEARVNSDKIILAVMHLLKNAIRHSSPGSRVQVQLSRDGDEAVICIRDTGSGIRPEDLPHIFERFWRRDTAHSTPGFGLGLPITQRIVELHGGSIAIDSIPSKETVATVRIPILLTS